MTEPDDTREYFSRQVEACMDSMYGTALRLTRSGADAEDLVAEAVTRAWAAIRTLEDRRRFRPWVFRILHNCFVSGYRRKAARPPESAYPDDGEEELAVLLNEQSDDFLVWWANPEREFFNDMLGDAIRTAIDRLPEAFRVTIQLVNVEGLSYDEAAAVLGVPPGTIRSRMKRGRTMLQKSLWLYARDAGLVGREYGNGRPQ